jgi:hypothetical protein
MAFLEAWHIRTRSHSCVQSGKHFVDDEMIVAALFPDPESSGWLRRDFSMEGWKNRAEVGEGCFSHWKTVYKAPVVHEKVGVTKESPIGLLRRLVMEEEEHTDKIRFILAVMLERQKVLVETDTQAVPSGILRVYEHRKEGDVFLIRDPNVSLDQVEEVQREVMDLLEKAQAERDAEDAAESEGIVQSEPENPIDEPENPAS